MQLTIMKMIMTHDYWTCGFLISTESLEKVANTLWKCSYSYLCTCIRNKYPNMQEWICMKCPHTSIVEGDQFLNSQPAWACWDMVNRGIVLEIPRLTVKRTLSLDANDIKHKTSLFSVQGKIYMVLFHGFWSFVIRHLCLMHKINA